MLPALCPTDAVSLSQRSRKYVRPALDLSKEAVVAVQLEASVSELQCVDTGGVFVAVQLEASVSELQCVGTGGVFVAVQLEANVSDLQCVWTQEESDCMVGHLASEVLGGRGGGIPAGGMVLGKQWAGCGGVAPAGGAWVHGDADPCLDKTVPRSHPAQSPSQQRSAVPSSPPAQCPAEQGLLTCATKP